MVVAGNIIQDFFDGGIGVGPAGSVELTETRNILVKNNLLSNPGNAVPPITVGSQDPETEGSPEQVRIADNITYQDGVSVEALRVYSARRLGVTGNTFVTLNNTSRVVAVYGTGDSEGTTDYSADIRFIDNLLYGTSLAGATDGFRLGPGAPTSAIRVSFENNRLAIPGDAFSVSSAITDPNIRVMGQPQQGLTFAAGVTTALSFPLDVVPTADLPAAGPSEDGRILIEDAGAGDRNLIIYAGGQRFRIDGGTPLP